MHRLAAVAAAALAFAVTAPDPAFATFPAPDGPTTAVVQRVEVPVDDTGAELLQMAVAMAFGAALASTRRRRPPMVQNLRS